MCMRFIFSCLIFHECLYLIRYEYNINLKLEPFFPTHIHLVFTNTRGQQFDKLEENCLVQLTAMCQITANKHHDMCNVPLVTLPADE